MQTRKTAYAVVTGAARMAAVIMLAGATIGVASRQAMANTDMAKKTGQPCAKCHTAAPALTSYGKKYKDSPKK